MARTSLVLKIVKTLASLRYLGGVLMHDINSGVDLSLDIGDLIFVSLPQLRIESLTFWFWWLLPPAAPEEGPAEDPEGM